LGDYDRAPARPQRRSPGSAVESWLAASFDANGDAASPPRSASQARAPRAAPLLLRDSAATASSSRAYRSAPLASAFA
jgi:hypothetical protein